MILPKIVAIGVYNSEIAAKNIAISKNRKTSMFEIELPIEVGGVSYIDSQSMPITDDIIICAKPGQIRHTKFPYKCYYVHMISDSGELYNRLVSTPDIFKTDRISVYQTIFSKLVKYYNTFTAIDEIIVQSLILELIYTIIQDSAKIIESKKFKNNNRIIIEKSLDYIEKNITENLSLENISDYVSLSPIYFHNCFKSAVGKTLHDYIEEQRIKKAINLLTTTDFPLTKIAYECGFSSQSYFSYVFKRRLKCTPREYAKEIFNKYEL